MAINLDFYTADVCSVPNKPVQFTPCLNVPYLLFTCEHRHYWEKKNSKGMAGVYQDIWWSDCLQIQNSWLQLKTENNLETKPYLCHPLSLLYSI